jgi:hypothetical protein
LGSTYYLHPLSELFVDMTSAAGTLRRFRKMALYMVHNMLASSGYGYNIKFMVLN